MNTHGYLIEVSNCIDYVVYEVNFKQFVILTIYKYKHIQTVKIPMGHSCLWRRIRVGTETFLHFQLD